jgi:hypothetical protein
VQPVEPHSPPRSLRPRATLAVRTRGAGLLRRNRRALGAGLIADGLFALTFAAVSTGRIAAACLRRFASVDRFACLDDLSPMSDLPPLGARPVLSLIASLLARSGPVRTGAGALAWRAAVGGPSGTPIGGRAARAAVPV